MKQLLLILFTLMWVTIGSSQVIDSKVSLSSSLSSDSTHIVGKAPLLVDAGHWYSSRMVCGKIFGFFGLSVKFPTEGTSAQTFDIRIRVWSKNTGASEWYTVATGIVPDKKEDFSFSQQDYDWWSPAVSFVQIDVVSSGTGSVNYAVDVTLL